MSRYCADLATTALLAPLTAYRAGALLASMAGGTPAFDQPAPIRHVHRDREAGFGIGYGNSSGYGTDRHYISNWGPQRFRCS